VVFEWEMRYGLSMRKRFVITCALVGSLTGSFSLQAIPSPELKAKYEPIVQRNPFGLKAIIVPPTQVATNVAPPAPKNEIYLTGITSIGYPKFPKKAYLMVREQTGKKETNYLTFVEGQKLKDIEVLAINPKDRTVKIRNSDGEVLLSFKTHGITNAVAAVAQLPRPGVPGMQPGPGGQGIQGGNVPGGIPPPALPGGQPTASLGGSAPPPLPTGTEDYSRPSIQNNMRGVASRNRNRGDLAVVPAPGAEGLGQPQQQPQQQVDAAEQYLKLLSEEEIARRQGKFFPPTPPP
jgi:hypothetical protein